MAKDKEKKQAVSKTKKSTDKKKFRFRPIKDMVSELKKVTWPTKKELLSYSISVGVFVVIMAVITGLMDLGAVNLIDWLNNAETGFASFFIS